MLGLVFVNESTPSNLIILKQNTQIIKVNKAEASSKHKVQEFQTSGLKSSFCLFVTFYLASEDYLSSILPSIMWPFSRQAVTHETGLMSNSGVTKKHTCFLVICTKGFTMHSSHFIFLIMSQYLCCFMPIQERRLRFRKNASWEKCGMLLSPHHPSS